jgi:hypothetical protein
MDIAVKIPGTWVTEVFKAGDVLIFSDTPMHKALPNKSMRFVSPSMHGISQRVPQ